MPTLRGQAVRRVAAVRTANDVGITTAGHGTTPIATVRSHSMTPTAYPIISAMGE